MRATLDALAREGARRMIAAALEVEVEEYVRRFADERDENGHAKVVRNGRGNEGASRASWRRSRGGVAGRDHAARGRVDRLG